MNRESFSWAWVGAFTANGGPRYLQIVEFMEIGISNQLLNPGDRLPPQRQLAEKLNVDLTTITRAYKEAQRRNLLEARGAAGTFVSAPKVDLTQMVDLSMNIPPRPVGIDLDDMLRQGLSQVLIRSDVDLLMTYHLGGGSVADRTAGSMWLEPMMGHVHADRVVVCPGAQAAIAALITALSKPGDVILTEPMIYPGLLVAARQLGRRVVTMEVDEEGALPESMAELCQRHQARLAYFNPTLQNPTTKTLSTARREAIAQVANAAGVYLIEDDPYWHFTDGQVHPLAYYAPKQTFYISTLAKCLLPGLRTAYIVAPDKYPVEQLLTALRSFVLMSAPLMTALTTQWIHDGSAGTLLNAIRNEAQERFNLARRILGSNLSGPAGGIHIWHSLPSGWDGHYFTQRARIEGLNIISHEAFCATEQIRAAQQTTHIRISLGTALSRFELVNALRRLTDLAARSGGGEFIV